MLGINENANGLSRQYLPEGRACARLAAKGYRRRGHAQSEATTGDNLGGSLEILAGGVPEKEYLPLPGGLGVLLKTARAFFLCFSWAESALSIIVKRNAANTPLSRSNINFPGPSVNMTALLFGSV